MAKTKKNPVAVEEAYKILKPSEWQAERKEILKQFEYSKELIVKKYDDFVIVCPVEEIDQLRYDVIVEGLSDDFLEDGRNQPVVQKREIQL